MLNRTVGSTECDRLWSEYEGATMALLSSISVQRKRKNRTKNSNIVDLEKCHVAPSYSLQSRITFGRAHSSIEHRPPVTLALI